MSPVTALKNTKNSRCFLSPVTGQEYLIETVQYERMANLKRVPIRPQSGDQAKPDEDYYCLGPSSRTSGKKSKSNQSEGSRIHILKTYKLIPLFIVDFNFIPKRVFEHLYPC